MGEPKEEFVVVSDKLYVRGPFTKEQAKEEAKALNEVPPGGHYYWVERVEAKHRSFSYSWIGPMKPIGAIRLRVVPLELRELNALVAQWHRHHKPVQGHRFSIGVIGEDGVIHGGASVGRPVARNGGKPSEVLEVTRLVTDGTPGACSALYAAAARVGKEMGYKRIQTYILTTEPGSSLKAAGWIDEGEAGGGQWKHTDGKPRRTDQPIEKKRRWAKALAALKEKDNG